MQTTHYYSGRFISIIKGIFTFIFWAVFLVSIVFSFLVLNGAKEKTDIPQDVTVLVLGCQVNGSEPSPMLQRRLDVAAEYLTANPTVPCVVTGGAGDGQEYTEAEVMKRYLVEQHGIAEDRIYTEDTATDTRENMVYSARVIETNNLPKNLLIASDSFHQYRASLLAKKVGFTYTAPLSSHSSIWVQPSYIAREFLSVVYTWVYGMPT